MPQWVWIVIAAAVVIAAVVIVTAAAASSRRKTRRLKKRFGPEYDRTVSEAGEQKTAEKELAARERNRNKLDIHPLPPAALVAYTRRWQAVQTAFVDDPYDALGDCGSACHRGDARARLPGRRFRSAGSRHLGRPPDGRRELPGRARHPSVAA